MVSAAVGWHCVSDARQTFFTSLLRTTRLDLLINWISLRGGNFSDANDATLWMYKAVSMFEMMKVFPCGSFEGIMMLLECSNSAIIFNNVVFWGVWCDLTKQQRKTRSMFRFTDKRHPSRDDHFWHQLTIKRALNRSKFRCRFIDPWNIAHYIWEKICSSSPCKCQWAANWVVAYGEWLCVERVKLYHSTARALASS